MTPVTDAGQYKCQSLNGLIHSMEGQFIDCLLVIIHFLSDKCMFCALILKRKWEPFVSNGECEHVNKSFCLYYKDKTNTDSYRIR